MNTITGKYGSALVFTTNHPETALEQYAVAQIRLICENKVSEGQRIRIMPDVHPGKSGPVGLTITVGDRILPAFIGTDIGCGISMAGIERGKLEFQKLDTVIRERVPAGGAVRTKPLEEASGFDLSRLHCIRGIDRERAAGSLGTLGAGNHFIEVNRDEEGFNYLTVHSGSRHLGAEVFSFYMRKGQKALSEQGVKVPYELTFLQGSLMEEYLHDLDIVREFAEWNRRLMIMEIARGMKWKLKDLISIPHNYVDPSGGRPMLRKGAISAKKAETVLIPANMKDGILVGTGLGNPEWNYSAPHGTGRIQSRSSVLQNHTVSEFRKEMQGIHSVSVGKGTLDEAPFAYRSLAEVMEVIGETVQIERVLRPVYNFKAAGREGKT